MNTVRGLLFSQIGYEPDAAIRVVYRHSLSDGLGEEAICRLRDDEGRVVDRPLVSWGRLWGSHWWTADFSDALTEGSYAAEVLDGGPDDPVVERPTTRLRVRRDVLWQATVRYTAVDQLERRQSIAHVKPGWYDAGTLWQEANSHCAMIIGLCDALRLRGADLDDDLRERMVRQIVAGCDYLVALQDHAAASGLPTGALVHDLLEHQDVVNLGDVSKAAATLAMAANALGGHPDFADRLDRYRHGSATAIEFFLSATPHGKTGWQRWANLVPDDLAITPPAEHRTADLLMIVQASDELAAAGHPDALAWRDQTLETVLSRQIHREDRRDGLFGHFRLYDSIDLAETVWAHNVVDGVFGSDMGQTFGQYVMPLVQIARRSGEMARRCYDAMRRYAYDYLLPACQRTPFLIPPHGHLHGKGWMHFAGLWHGCSAVYPLTAAMALEFESLFDDPAFRDLAVANLQWIAGLNPGLTRDGSRGCCITSYDIPEGIAWPVSLFCDIGDRTAGCWLRTRGAICNGFGCGRQFATDRRPSLEDDGPHALHDEDWLVHAGGWLCGLSRWSTRNTDTKTAPANRMLARRAVPPLSPGR